MSTGPGASPFNFEVLVRGVGGGGVALAGSSGIGAEGRGLQTLILFNKKIVSCRIRPYYFITLIVSRFVLHTELSHFLKLTSRVKIFWEKSCWHHKCRLFIANILLFQRFPIKEDTLFATLNGEIVYPVSLRLKEPENHTLFSGTYPLRPNNGVHSSPREQLQEYICIQCFVYKKNCSHGYDSCCYFFLAKNPDSNQL